MQCPHGNQKNSIVISKIQVDLYVRVSYTWNDFVRYFRQPLADVLSTANYYLYCWILETNLDEDSLAFAYPVGTHLNYTPCYTRCYMRFMKDVMGISEITDIASTRTHFSFEHFG